MDNSLNRVKAYVHWIMQEKNPDSDRLLMAMDLEKMLAVVDAAKAVWDSDEFIEDDDGRTDFIPGDLMLKLGDAVETVEE